MNQSNDAQNRDEGILHKWAGITHRHTHTYSHMHTHTHSHSHTYTHSQNSRISTQARTNHTQRWPCIKHNMHYLFICLFVYYYSTQADTTGEAHKHTSTHPPTHSPTHSPIHLPTYPPTHKYDLADRLSFPSAPLPPYFLSHSPLTRPPTARPSILDFSLEEGYRVRSSHSPVNFLDCHRRLLQRERARERGGRERASAREREERE
jgi:hypothetical protein